MRGDATFARIDVSLLMDARWRKLNASAKMVYVAAYLTAVQHRVSTLPTEYDQAALADRAGLDQRTYAKAQQSCIDNGLLQINARNQIFVPNVRENHPKLTFKDDPIEAPQREDTGPIRPIIQDNTREKIIQDNTIPEGDGRLRQPTEQEFYSSFASLENRSETECIRLLSTGNPTARASTTLEDLACNLPDADIRHACAEVCALKLKNNLPINNVAAILTAKLKKLAEGHRHTRSLI